MKDIAVRVEGLSKRYRVGKRQPGRSFREAIAEAASAPFRRGGGESDDGEFWALRDLSFEVEHGEFIGIIGRNGAGKSTLLKILSRITEPTSGRAEVYGRVGSMLEVGTGFHPELTGRENVYLNGAILGMRRVEIEQRFDEIVAFAEVERFIDTPVKHYSSGMYVRLAFAVAAHLEPEILIVDEVLAVGDVAFQRKSMAKLQDARNRGATVLLVTHNLTAVTRFCTRALLLRAGTIVKSGNPLELLTSYLDAGRDRLTAGSEAFLFDRSNPHSDALHIESVRVLDHLGRSSGQLFCGRPVTITATVNGPPLDEAVGLGIYLNNLAGQRVAGITTFSQRLSESTRGRQEVRFQVDSLQLVPGTYTLDVNLVRRGVGPLDAVEAALTLNVFSTDVFGTGEEVAANYGVFYLRGTWETSSLQPEVNRASPGR